LSTSGFILTVSTGSSKVLVRECKPAIASYECFDSACISTIARLVARNLPSLRCIALLVDLISRDCGLIARGSMTTTGSGAGEAAVGRKHRSSSFFSMKILPTIYFKLIVLDTSGRATNSVGQKILCIELFQIVSSKTLVIPLQSPVYV
jgi:hypothetical protein